jgi:hypothetical protein
MDDLAVLIDDKRSAVRHARLGNENAILLGDLALRKIAQQRNRQHELGGKLSLRKRIVGADPQDLCFLTLEFSDTSLVRQKFFGSTRRESSREKSQHDRVLAAEAGQFHRLARGGRQRKIGSHVPLFQLRVRGLNLLGVQAGCEQATQQGYR